MPDYDVHYHQAEVAAADTGKVIGIFEDEIVDHSLWKIQHADYDVGPGVQALETPGHTAGHMVAAH